MQYEYDPFQKKAIEAINQGDSVLVSAPTGSGKTAIAEYAIQQALERNERVIYTAPIKAISNQKYRDFLADFPAKVGILTGDVSIEPVAPVLIMTTEIYRNQLFENPERHRSTAWVIFDEVHYLDDYERGTVWEEAIMFSHPGTRFLALSATAPNIREMARWIESLQNHRITVIEERKRPVELVHYFQCQNEIFNDIEVLKKKGFRNIPPWAHDRPRWRRRHRMRGFEKDLRLKANSTHDLMRHLIQNKRLPCLYFAFGRKRVEQLAAEHMHLDLLNAEERNSNGTQYDQLMEKYNLGHEPSGVEMGRLVRHGIAYHHAGMLPTLKEVVERLFTAKRIRLIFTTETFALGINMPARTVVFDELRKFYGFGFNDLTTRDYYQMAGRAGRRNIDAVGYVYSRVNPRTTSYAALLRIINGQMEPIRSQFNASYATLLNLYRHLGMRLVEVYPKSFHFHQWNAKGTAPGRLGRTSAKKQKRGYANIERKLALLRNLGYITDEGLTAKGKFASCIYGYELVLSELLESGFLNHLNVTEVCVLLAALVYEPRKNEHMPRMPTHFHHLERATRRVVRKIHEAESQAQVSPLTKGTHFHLSAAMEAWIKGTEFHHLSRHTDIDEGIIIRYFRMVIQLLRELEQASEATGRLRELSGRALTLINRDIVDAEKLLRTT